jgi:hypothetical protein
VLDMVDVTERGSATTAPPEPRRADYRPAPPAPAQDEPEDEGWPLYDETGETVGRYATVDWAKRFEDAAAKLDGAARKAFLDNNHDTAKQLFEDTDDEGLAARLRALYEPPPQQSAAKLKQDWSLPANIVGQEKKQLAIYQQLDDQTETAAEIDDLWKFHEAFFDKLGAIKMSAAKRRFEERKIMLGGGK